MNRRTNAATCTIWSILLLVWIVIAEREKWEKENNGDGGMGGPLLSKHLYSYNTCEKRYYATTQNLSLLASLFSLTKTSCKQRLMNTIKGKETRSSNYSRMPRILTAEAFPSVRPNKEKSYGKYEFETVAPFVPGIFQNAPKPSTSASSTILRTAAFPERATQRLYKPEKSLIKVVQNKPSKNNYGDKTQTNLRAPGSKKEKNLYEANLSSPEPNEDNLQGFQSSNGLTSPRSVDLNFVDEVPLDNSVPDLLEISKLTKNDWTKSFLTNFKDLDWQTDFGQVASNISYRWFTPYPRRMQEPDSLKNVNHDRNGTFREKIQQDFDEEKNVVNTHLEDTINVNDHAITTNQSASGNNETKDIFTSESSDAVTTYKSTTMNGSHKIKISAATNNVNGADTEQVVDSIDMINMNAARIAAINDTGPINLVKETDTATANMTEDKASVTSNISDTSTVSDKMSLTVTHTNKDVEIYLKSSNTSVVSAALSNDTNQDKTSMTENKISPNRTNFDEVESTIVPTNINEAATAGNKIIYLSNNEELNAGGDKMSYVESDASSNNNIEKNNYLTNSRIEIATDDTNMSSPDTYLIKTDGSDVITSTAEEEYIAVDTSDTTFSSKQADIVASETTFPGNETDIVGSDTIMKTKGTNSNIIGKSSPAPSTFSTTDATENSEENLDTIETNGNSLNIEIDKYMSTENEDITKEQQFFPFRPSSILPSFGQNPTRAFRESTYLNDAFPNNNLSIQQHPQPVKNVFYSQDTQELPEFAGFKDNNNADYVDGDEEALDDELDYLGHNSAPILETTIFESENNKVQRAAFDRLEAMRSVLKNSPRSQIRREREGYIAELELLPPEIILQYDSDDVLSLVRCPPGFLPLSLTLCGRPLAVDVPARPVCPGNSVYDPVEKSCMAAASQVEPISRCPEGYKIARILGHKIGSPCRSTLKVEASLVCDPPYILDEEVGHCLKNTTAVGTIGCPTGSLLFYPETTHNNNYLYMNNKEKSNDNNALGISDLSSLEGMSAGTYNPSISGVEKPFNNYFLDHAMHFNKGTRGGNALGNSSSRNTVLQQPSNFRPKQSFSSSKNNFSFARSMLAYNINGSNEKDNSIARESKNAIFSLETANRGVCQSMKQLKKYVQCPDTPTKRFTPHFLSDGQAQCIENFRFPSLNPSSIDRCPKGAEEELDYSHIDAFGRPQIFCTTEKIHPALTSCPHSSIDYKEYIKSGNPIPVMFNASLGNPESTCVQNQVVSHEPICPDPHNQVPFVYLSRELQYPLPYSDMLPVHLLKEEMKLDWGSFTENKSISGTPHYTDNAGNSVTVACFSFEYAKPTLRCPEGFYQRKNNPAQCRKKGYTDFVLTCPAGYVLNTSDLLYNNYDKPSPLCIGRSPSHTKLECPEVDKAMLKEIRKRTSPASENSVAKFLPDSQHNRCVLLDVLSPLWKPSKLTLTNLFKSQISALEMADEDYPGVAGIPTAEELLQVLQAIPQ